MHEVPAEGNCGIFALSSMELVSAQSLMNLGIYADGVRISPASLATVRSVRKEISAEWRRRSDDPDMQLLFDCLIGEPEEPGKRLRKSFLLVGAEHQHLMNPYVDYDALEFDEG